MYINYENTKKFIDAHGGSGIPIKDFIQSGSVSCFGKERDKQELALKVDRDLLILDLKKSLLLAKLDYEITREFNLTTIINPGDYFRPYIFSGDAEEMYRKLYDILDSEKATELAIWCLTMGCTNFFGRYRDEKDHETMLLRSFGEPCKKLLNEFKKQIVNIK